MSVYVRVYACVRAWGFEFMQFSLLAGKIGQNSLEILSVCPPENRIMNPPQRR